MAARASGAGVGMTFPNDGRTGMFSIPTFRDARSELRAHPLSPLTPPNTAA